MLVDAPGHGGSLTVAKKKKDFAGDPGGLIGDAIFDVIEPTYREGEKRRKARSRSPRRTYYRPKPKTSQKEIVFRLLPQANHLGFGDSKESARSAREES